MLLLLISTRDCAFYAKSIERETFFRVEVCAQTGVPADCSTIAVNPGWTNAPTVDTIALGGDAANGYTITVTPNAVSGIAVADNLVLTGTINNGAVTWATTGGCVAKGLC